MAKLTEAQERAHAEQVLSTLKKRDPMIEEMVRDANDRTREIHSQLVPHEPRGRLPEPLFKEYFLPFFSGEKAATRESNVFSEWIGVAGSPMSEVDVFGEKGETLFTVPSLFTSNMLNVIDRQPRNAMNEIIQSAHNYRGSSPLIGMKYLNKALKDKHQELTQNGPASNAVSDRWQAIFYRYGKVNKANVKGQESTDDGPDVDYDL